MDFEFDMEMILALALGIACGIGVLVIMSGFGKGPDIGTGIKLIGFVAGCVTGTVFSKMILSSG